MRRRLAALAALPLLALASSSQAATSDPIGDLIVGAMTGGLPGTPAYRMRATLYHAGAAGVGALDSLGCKVVAMRTAAIDKKLIPRRTVLFIKETVGLPMPDGGVHDGYWYASDVGGAIKGEKIEVDLELFEQVVKASLGLTENEIKRVYSKVYCVAARSLTSRYWRSSPRRVRSFVARSTWNSTR